MEDHANTPTIPTPMETYPLAPPPSYALSEAQASASRNPSGASTIIRSNPHTADPYTPNSKYNVAINGLLLHVYNTGSLFHRQWTITLPDKQTALYVVSIPAGVSWAMEPMVFKRGSAGGPVAGTAQTIPFSSGLDLTINPEEGPGDNRRPMTASVQRDGLFTRRHSVTLAGRNFWIKGTSEGGYGSLKIVDEGEKVWAVFVSQDWSWDKIGRIEFKVADVPSEMVDGIVISLMGLSSVEKKKNSSRSAVYGGGSVANNQFI